MDVAKSLAFPPAAAFPASLSEAVESELEELSLELSTGLVVLSVVDLESSALDPAELELPALLSELSLLSLLSEESLLDELLLESDLVLSSADSVLD